MYFVCLFSRIFDQLPNLPVSGDVGTLGSGGFSGALGWEGKLCDTAESKLDLELNIGIGNI